MASTPRLKVVSVGTNDPRIDAARHLDRSRGEAEVSFARPAGDEIVLESEEQEGLSFRWVFAEISADRACGMPRPPMTAGNMACAPGDAGCDDAGLQHRCELTQADT